MALSRSPKYPSLNLSDALERIKKVYNLEKRHSTTDEIIVQHLGYKGLNGASNAILGTLKRYGLLIPTQDGKFQVSEEAVSIIDAARGRLEPDDAMKRVAFRPQIFAELYAEYGDELPSDQNLRRYLMDEKRFSPQAALEVIRVYRETLALVEGGNDYYTDDPSDEPEEDFPMQSQSPLAPVNNRVAPPVHHPPTLHPPQIQSRTGKVLAFQTFEGSEAVLHLPSDVTRESIGLIVALLQAQQIAFPTRQAQEATAVSTPISSLPSSEEVTPNASTNSSGAKPSNLQLLEHFSDSPNRAG